MGVYKRKGSDKWYLCYTVDGELIRRSSNTTEKQKAKKMLKVILGSIADGTYQHVRRDDQISLREYAEEFLVWAKNHTKPSTYCRYKTSLIQLLRFFKKVKLHDLKRKHILEYQSFRYITASKATVNRDLACLRKLYNNAILDGYCTTNPVNSVKFDKESKKDFYYLEDNEANALLNACDTIATKSFVILGLYAGLRKEEILSLKWTDVNLSDKILTIRNAKSGNDDKVPMNKDIFEHLRSVLKNEFQYVVAKPDGSRYKDFRRAWMRIIKKANIKDCRPHILRHTFATALARAGVDIQTIKELGRWSDLKLVERYTHIDMAHRTRSISKIDGVFGSDTVSDTVDKN